MSYRYLVRLALNFHQGDAGIVILGLDGPAEFHIFLQEFDIVLFGIPLGLPVAYNADSKA
jgi:hypothetical protein